MMNKHHQRDPVQVMLAPSLPDPTDDQGLWAAIRDRTNAIGFGPYSEFINRLFCLESDKGPLVCGETEGVAAQYGSPSIEDRKTDLFQRRPSIYGVDAYQLLKLATQAFLSFEAGIVIKGERNDGDGTYPDPDRDNADPDGMQTKLKNYLASLGDHRTLPYLERISKNINLKCFKRRQVTLL